MSVGGPSKNCPRCNTVLPMQSVFCGNCGYQFNASPGSAPQGANYGPPQYVGQNAPGGWPQAQPGYPPQGQPGYPPQGQPGYPPQGQPGFGYPAAPAAAQQQKKGGCAGKVVALVLVLVIVGGGAAAWFLYLNPGRCSGPLFDRHGLQSDVSLPSGCAFDSHPATQTTSDSGATFSVDIWTWTVSGSDPTAVQQFYQDNLKGNNGWTKITPSTDKSTGEKDITACQGNQYLSVGAGTKLDVPDSTGKTTRTLNAPSGGSALGIALLTATNNKATLALAALCSGSTPPGGINP